MAVISLPREDARNCRKTFVNAKKSEIRRKEALEFSSSQVNTNISYTERVKSFINTFPVFSGKILFKIPQVNSPRFEAILPAFQTWNPYSAKSLWNSMYQISMKLLNSSVSENTSLDNDPANCRGAATSIPMTAERKSGSSARSVALVSINHVLELKFIFYLCECPSSLSMVKMSTLQTFTKTFIFLFL